MTGMIDAFYRYDAQLKPRAIALIKRFEQQGVPMVLASTSDRDLLTAALTRLGVLHHFEGLYTATELKTTKHEPKIYLTAAKHLGTKPKYTAVVEDALHCIKTAKNAGFYVIGMYDNANADDWDGICTVADETICP